jgi:hypothetical protein
MDIFLICANRYFLATGYVSGFLASGLSASDSQASHIFESPYDHPWISLVLYRQIAEDRTLSDRTDVKIGSLSQQGCGQAI